MIKDVRISPRFSATAMFARYRSVCSCKDKQDEFVVFTRIGRGTKRFLVNNVMWGLMDRDSEFTVGDVITTDKDDTYFLVGMTKSLQGNKGEFYKTNCQIDIYSPQKEYDEYGDEVGITQILKYESLQCVFEDVTSKLFLYEYGLNPSMQKRLIIPQDIDIKVGDSIVLNEERLRIESINKYDFAPFLYISCHDDERE